MIYLALILITYISFLRVLIYNSSIWFLLFVFIISAGIFIKSFYYKLPFLTINKSLFIAFAIILFFSSFTYLTYSGDREALWPLILINLYSLLYFAGYKFVGVFGIKESYNIIRKWALGVYIIDSIFIYIEVLSRYTNPIFINLYRASYIQKIEPYRYFYIPTSGKGFFSELPLSLGPRGFPHYTVTLFIITALILIYEAIKNRRSSRYLLVTNTFSILIILGVKTHILIFLFLILYEFSKKLSIKFNIYSFYSWPVF